MMAEITESVLKSFSTFASFDRGQELYQSNAVFDTFRSGNLLTGKCEGTNTPFYQLTVQIDEGGIQEALCNCPYDRGGYCKHIIALLLSFINEPEIFIETQNFEKTLKKMDKDTLVNLMIELMDEKPDVLTWLKNAVSDKPAQPRSTKTKSSRKTEISKTVYKRQIQGILRSLQGYRMSEAYWLMGGMVEELDNICDTAYDFLVAGDAHNALSILTTLLIEVGESYDQFDDSDGYLGGFLSRLELPLVETILSADLGKTERRNLFNELEPEVRELSAYGIDNLGGILMALNRGWSGKPLFELEDFDPDDTTIIEAKLNVLLRQERIEEYLTLCLQAGKHLRFIQKKIEMREFDEAVDVAWKNLTQAEDVLFVSKALRESGKLSEAVRLARNGLGLAGDKGNLGIWLGTIEEAQGNVEQAIQAYLISFTAKPALEIYSKLKKLSDKDWIKIQPELIQIVKDSHREKVLIDIFIFEEEWDKVVETADKISSFNYPLIEKVADVLLPHRPEWVIEACRKQVEGLIAKTQSKYYAIAVHWLGKMKQAYLSLNRKADWVDYLEGLKSTYSRRPALQAELSKL